MRVIFLLILLISQLCIAAPKENSALIKQIETYLNDFENLQADFTQNGNGQTAKGILRIAKPGKFRWEYIDDNLLIISTGDTIIYVDNELNNVHYISADDTIAGILSQEKFNFTDGNYVIENLSAYNHEVSLLIKNKSDASMGKINLIFALSPMSLKKIEVLGIDNELIQLTLSKLTYPEKFDPELFNYYENHNRRW